MASLAATMILTLVGDTDRGSIVTFPLTRYSEAMFIKGCFWRLTSKLRAAPARTKKLIFIERAEVG